MVDVIHHHHPNTPFFLPNIQKIPSMNAAAPAKLFRSCPTLCNPIDGTHQAPLSLGFSRQKYWSGLPLSSTMHACMLSHCSCVQLCAILWTAAHQAPLCAGFSRQEYWSGLPYQSHYSISSIICLLVPHCSSYHLLI